MIVETDEKVEEFLEHVGVKGMKWGVRRQRRQERLERVSRREGSLLDKAHAVGQVSPLDMIKAKGKLAEAAGSRASKRAARRDRIQAGEGTVKDLLVQMGTVRLADLGPLDR